MSIEIIEAFLIGLVTGGVILFVTNTLFRKAVENAVKAEVTRLEALLEKKVIVAVTPAKVASVVPTPIPAVVSTATAPVATA